MSLYALYGLLKISQKTPCLKESGNCGTHFLNELRVKTIHRKSSIKS